MLTNAWNACHNNDFPLQGVRIRRAPYPNEIIWENVGFPVSEKRKRTALIYLASFLLMGASFGIALGLALYQVD